MKKKTALGKAFGHTPDRGPERGISLIIVIMIMSFMLTVGVALLTITSTGPKVAANIRSQQQAFNAAEAGFDTAWTTIEENFASGLWGSFEDHYLKKPNGIDDPSSENYYFRGLTDDEILNLIDPGGDGVADLDNVLYYQEPFITEKGGTLDSRYTYTVFLIDDETGTKTSDPADALMVCIGCVKVGNKILSTSRLEVLLNTLVPGAKT
jgi:hypothetical protein